MKRTKTATIVVKGNTDHNLPFLVAIGQLVISWANNESLFLSVLQVLFRDSKTAAMTWASHKNSRTRLQFVQALVEEKVADKSLKDRLDQAVIRFVALSRTRNLYCHAMYQYDEQLRLKSVFSHITEDSYKTISKSMGLATLNEIQNASMELLQFNEAMWTLVHDFESYLGVTLIDTEASEDRP